jgi:hypothetical protein
MRKPFGVVSADGWIITEPLLRGGPEAKTAASKYIESMRLMKVGKIFFTVTTIDLKKSA